MIDRAARNEALELLRRLVSDDITNWELEDKWPKSDVDPAINCILRWLWSLYDDDKEISLRGILNERELAILERCTVFLEDEQEFPTKALSADETRVEQAKWGKEWRCDCTVPEDDRWPFAS